MASAGTARSVARRPAFTLVEMLVVIGIMMLLMGLGVASIIRTPRLDGMVAAEQAVADAVRQARHTAQTTGQPVVLRLKANERSISGLVRQPLWHATEGWPTIADDSTPPQQIEQPGRTATGLTLPEAFCRDGVLANGFDDTAGAANRMLLPQVVGRDGEAGQPLAGGARLWRGSGTLRPPLLLSVAVNPPLALSPSDSAFVPLIPLAMVGPDAPPDLGAGSAFASYGQSFMGIMLVNTQLPDSSGRISAVAPSWEIHGWFGSGPAVEVSSIANTPPDLAATVINRKNVVILKGTGSGDVTGDAEAWPLTGGRWTEIGLLVDGDRLILYRDGRRVGEVAGAAAVALAEPAAERVYVGIAKVPGIPVAAGSPPSPGALLSAVGARLDDVRLERLGDAVVGNLPSGVSVGPLGGADASRRIVCHPDGRVEVLWEAAAHPAGQPMPLQLTNADGGMTAEIEIAANGTVKRSATLVGAAP